MGGGVLVGGGTVLVGGIGVFVGRPPGAGCVGGGWLSPAGVVGLGATGELVAVGKRGDVAVAGGDGDGDGVLLAVAVGLAVAVADGDGVALGVHVAVESVSPAGATLSEPPVNAHVAKRVGVTSGGGVPNAA